MRRIMVKIDRYMKKFYFVVLLLLFVSLPIVAEKFPVDSVAPLLKEVVVTANRTQVNKNDVPLTISVITRKQIEESSESALLPVLSQRVPGLFLTQKGVTGFGVSSGSAGTVNIRGVGQSNKVLMLFDGEKSEPYCYEGPNASLVNDLFGEVGNTKFIWKCVGACESDEGFLFYINAEDYTTDEDHLEDNPVLLEVSGFKL